MTRRDIPTDIGMGMVAEVTYFDDGTATTCFRAKKAGEETQPAYVPDGTEYLLGRFNVFTGEWREAR